MGLLRFYIGRELNALHKEGIRLRVIGDYSAFQKDVVAMIDTAIAKTAGNDRLTLVMALNYGARTELAGAARALARRVADGSLAPEAIDEAAIENELDTADLPPLDLLIRTSGEHRLSNFLLWQAAYAELVFLDLLWPDFDEATFNEALTQFAGRERRFGGR